MIMAIHLRQRLIMDYKLKIKFALVTSALILVLFLFFNLKIISDVGQFMPTANDDPQLKALMMEIQNGPSATILMLRLYGANPEKLSELSNQLTSDLNLQRNIFGYVKNSSEDIDVNKNSKLFQYRYLLVSNIDWSENGLRQAFQDRLSELRSGAGHLLDGIIESDPQLIFLKYIKQAFTTDGPHLLNGVWFNVGETEALILVKVKGNSLDLNSMQIAINSINQSFEKIAYSTSVNIEIAGPGKMAVETRDSIEKVMKTMTNLVIFLLVAIFLFAYRSLRSIWLAVLPLIFGILTALTITQLFFGKVHSIVLVFGIALLSVCLDYPLHLFSHLRSNETVKSSLEKIWPTLRLSSISTILAFFSLYGSGFEGLDQLAIFASSGLFCALMFTKYVLPSLASSDKIKPRLFEINFKFSFYWKILIAAVLISFPSIYLITKKDIWETSIHAISPIPAAARERDRVLRHELNVAEISHVFITSSNSIESALKSSEIIVTGLEKAKIQGIIKSIWYPSKILPSRASQQSRISKLPSQSILRANLIKALEGMPFNVAGFEPWIEAVSLSNKLPQLSYSDLQGTIFESIIRQGLFRYADKWMVVIHVSGIASESLFNDWLDKNMLVAKHHIAIKHATQRLLDGYRDITFKRFMTVLIVLLAIILIWSKSIIRSLWIFLPVFIGISVSLISVLYLGLLINVFHILALLLVLGMGLDYSLFFNNNNTADELVDKQNLHAIALSAISTSSAFSILAFSDVSVLSGIGQIVSVGIATCFFCSWLLTGPRQKHYE